MIVKLGAAALDLTPECKARLEELRKSPNDLNQWRLFNEEFGMFDVLLQPINYCKLIGLDYQVYLFVRSSHSAEPSILIEASNMLANGRAISKRTATKPLGTQCFSLDHWT